MFGAFTRGDYQNFLYYVAPPSLKETYMETHEAEILLSGKPLYVCAEGSVDFIRQLRTQCLKKGIAALLGPCESGG